MRFKTLGNIEGCLHFREYSLRCFARIGCCSYGTTYNEIISACFDCFCWRYGALMIIYTTGVLPNARRYYQETVSR